MGRQQHGVENWLGLGGLGWGGEAGGVSTADTGQIHGHSRKRVGR